MLKSFLLFSFAASLAGALSAPLQPQLLVESRVFSEDNEMPVEHNGVPLRRLRMESCDNIKPAQIEFLIKSYPNFTVTCEKELTLLYPSELDGPLEDQGTVSRIANFHKFQLTEISVLLEISGGSLLMPLAQCIYLSNPGTSGAVEYKLTIGGALSGNGEVSSGLPIPMFMIFGLPLPALGLGVSLGFSKSFSRLFVLDNICAFDGFGVRPIVSMATIECLVKVRRWDISLLVPAKQSEWFYTNQTVFTGHSPVFDCVSEEHVAGVCEWPEDRARDEHGEEVRIVSES